MGKTKLGRYTKIMSAGGGAGLPLTIHAAPASPNEVHIIIDALLESFVDKFPE
jgi:hypothetical protein